mmetsp:Transcript_4229/g.6870  ORF Transcript_4229/g.6870 Transcript_4229/m.6870 type:complete len:297 (+) Transcript_4229:79-969(+)
MGERGTCSANAAVYYESGGWKPADSGLSVVDVYLNVSTGAYRVVALDAANQNPAINSNVWPELKYTKSSSTFHSWVDQTGRTYGLNFATQNDADTFSKGMSDALAKLKKGSQQSVGALDLQGARKSSGGATRRPDAARNVLGQGARAASGAIMQTMPKDMSSAFGAQREADIAMFRAMSKAKKSGSTFRGGGGGGAPSPMMGKRQSQDNRSTSPKGRAASPALGGGSSKFGGAPKNSSGGGSGGGGGGKDEFTDAELRKWKENVIAAVRDEIDAVKREIIDALNNRGGGGGGGRGW